MKCPRCDIYTCKEFVEQVLIDECPKCGGFWLDAGELSTAFGIDSIEALLLENLAGSLKGPIPCPKCAHEMGLLTIQDDTVEKKRTTVDMCRKCHGIWLDAGELEHLMIFEKRLNKFEQHFGNPENEPKRRGGIRFITGVIERGRKKVKSIKKHDDEVNITNELKVVYSKPQRPMTIEQSPPAPNDTSQKQAQKAQEPTYELDDKPKATVKHITKMRTIASKK